jgi:hypothetical protein
MALPQARWSVLWAGEEAGATSSPTPTPPRPSSSRLGQAAEQQTQDPSPARDSPVENERDERIRLLQELAEEGWSRWVASSA